MNFLQSFAEALGSWQVWLWAALPAGVAFAVLKRKVSVGKRAVSYAGVGALVASMTDDQDFARIGLTLARREWGRRKVWLGFLTASSAVLLTACVLAGVGGWATWPAWTGGVTLALGGTIWVASKY